MTDTVNIYDAKTNLSKLVDRAAAGEEIVTAKAGKPKQVAPYRTGKAPWRAESWASPTSQMISMLRCHPKYRNISSR
jgi:antitoxin (DNA-binding transcriptional repressor) of toxin-antitoxin stability system